MRLNAIAMMPNLRPSGWMGGKLQLTSPEPLLSRISPAMSEHLGIACKCGKPCSALAGDNHG